MKVDAIGVANYKPMRITNISQKNETVTKTLTQDCKPTPFKGKGLATVGAGTGALIGAFLGGPLGAVIGATLMGVIGAAEDDKAPYTDSERHELSHYD